MPFFSFYKSCSPVPTTPPMRKAKAVHPMCQQLIAILLFYLKIAFSPLFPQGSTEPVKIFGPKKQKASPWVLHLTLKVQ